MGFENLIVPHHGSDIFRHATFTDLYAVFLLLFFLCSLFPNNAYFCQTFHFVRDLLVLFSLFFRQNNARVKKCRLHNKVCGFFFVFVRWLKNRFSRRISLINLFVFGTNFSHIFEKIEWLITCGHPCSQIPKTEKNAFKKILFFFWKWKKKKKYFIYQFVKN